MSHELKGQTALITGAAKRIGRETALTLAGRGINVIIHFNRSDAEARRLAGELQQKGVNAWTIGADFRHPEEYQTLIEQAQQMTGSLDILINNASIFPTEAVTDLSWSGISQGKHAGRNMAGANERFTEMPFFFSDLFEFGYEAVGDVDTRLDTFADWQEPNKTGVIYYLDEGHRVRGAMMCNVWEKVDAARALIRKAQPMRVEDLRNAIR